jgi:hypothetical protein
MDTDWLLKTGDSRLLRANLRAAMSIPSSGRQMAATQAIHCRPCRFHRKQIASRWE